MGSQATKGSSWHYFSIGLQNPLTHLIALILAGPKASPKFLLQVWESFAALAEVNPFIPGELAQGRDVSHFSQCGTVWVGALQLEEVLGSQCEDTGAPFCTIAPEA